MFNGVYKQLLQFVLRPVFLLADLIGLIALISSKWLPEFWGAGMTTVGSTLLTIGVTLPIAIFYQLKSNAEAFKILDVCNKSGIQAIFSNRKRDSVDLRSAINTAINSSSKFFMLGIAFRSFFNPSAEEYGQVREKIIDPKTEIKVLLLDPDSPAATRRKEIELGNATIADINYTLDVSIVAIMQERIKKILQNEPSFINNICHFNENDTNDLVNQLVDKINFQVRLYQTEPTSLIMKFDNGLFTEQYHRGRPDSIPFGSCIGKYVPVIQFESSSMAFSMYDYYLQQLWNENEDYSIKLLKKSITTLPNKYKSKICKPLDEET